MRRAITTLLLALLMYAGLLWVSVAWKGSSIPSQTSFSSRCTTPAALAVKSPPPPDSLPIRPAIFWTSETAFWLVWQTDLMPKLGAILGLSLGYVVKYNLDRRFVFVNSRLEATA